MLALVLAGGITYWLTFELHWAPQWLGVILLLVCFNAMVSDVFVDKKVSTGLPLVEKAVKALAQRLGESEAERLARQIGRKPSDLDDLVLIGELLEADDRTWVIKQLELTTTKHRV